MIQERQAQTIVNGKKTVTTATTAEALGATANIPSGEIRIKAEATNTGIIYVGNASVAAANGFELAAGEELVLKVADLASVYIDASVSTDGVSYIYT
jgi:hypothetical protein